VAGSAFTDVRARGTTMASASIVGGPIVESAPIPVVPQAAPCETPVVAAPAAPVAPPSEVRQSTCVMCYVCCPPCPIEMVCPPNGTVVSPTSAPGPVPGAPAQPGAPRPNSEPTPIVAPHVPR
jgi:hypothetical protein